ncbi:MAG: putative bifunctional diguanylate cyclase/phosphodiesterase [Planctomycetota bacterium]
MINQLADIMCIASALVILVIMFGRGRRDEEITDHSRSFIFLGIGLLIGFSVLHLVDNAVPNSITGVIGERVSLAMLSRGGGVLASYLFIIFGLILSVPKAVGDKRLQDLNEQVTNAQQGYHKVNELLSSLLHSSLSGVMVLDVVRDDQRGVADFRCRMMNGAAEQILGRSAASLIGQQLFEQVPCLERTSVAKEVKSVIATGLPYKDEWFCDTVRTPCWYQIAATRIGDGVTVTFADINDRKLSEEKLKHAALHDALTGLPNRAMFMEQLGRAIRCTKHFTDHQFAVLFLDFDRFKIVNDSLGHEAGDQLLLNIASRLQETLDDVEQTTKAGAKHVAARLGGDEFVVLLDGVRDMDWVMQLADRLQAVLAAPHDLDGQEVVSTASIGIVLSDGRYDRADDVIRDADTAMYVAKTSGKARNVVFDPTMQEDDVNRVELESELRHALETMQFELHYEPIVDLASGRIAGVESLVRWQHPERGLISAADFLDVAEDVGLLMPIGRWAIREACTTLQHWRKSYPSASNVALHVNLSRQELCDPELLDSIRAVLDETGLAAADLRLELDERMLLDHLDELADALAGLDALGVGVVLDDFGAGPSTLRLINRLPVNLLKLDRSFLTAAGENTDDAAVIGAIIDLAHNLNMSVVAKAVETPEQLELLRSMDCDLCQGHIYRAPMSPQDVEALLEQDEPFERAA